MKEILNRFKNEILEHEESKNFASLLQTIDLELYKIKQKEDNLKLKNYKFKIEIKTMQEFIEIQNLAFLLNCGWHYGSNEPCKKINNEYDSPPLFIFIGKYLTVGFESDKEFFKNHINKQISINELKIIVEKNLHNV